MLYNTDTIKKNIGNSSRKAVKGQTGVIAYARLDKFTVSSGTRASMKTG
jgi:hypothetical protein